MDHFSSRDGLRIVFEQWGKVSDAPSVVLHHGYVADANLNWGVTGVIAALVAAGRHVVAIDARGHGRSDKPHAASYYGEPKMARDLVQLFDMLELSQLDLVGYSMGAIVSLLTAIGDKRVRRLAVGGVGCAVVELGGVDTRVLDNLALVAALRTDDVASITEPGVAGFRKFADLVKADRLALAAHAEVVHAQPLELERITAKTLVIAGEADPLAQRPEVLAAAIPDAELLRVSGDHFGALLDPAFVKGLVSFIAPTAAVAPAGHRPGSGSPTDRTA